MSDLVFRLVGRDMTAAAFAAVKKGLAGLDGALASSRERMTAFGKSVGGIGLGLSAITAPAGLAFAGMMRGAADFERAMNGVKAVTGATGAEFTALRDQAKALGASTSFSAGQAAEAQGELAKAGFDVQEVIAALPGVLDLAASAQLGLGEAAETAANILRGYGKTAGEIGAVGDILTATANKTTTGITDLGYAFKYVGPLAATVGIAFEDTAAMLGRLGDAGIRGEMAGTSLRSAISSLLSPTKATAEALASVGVSATDATGAARPFLDVLADLSPHADNAAAMMGVFGVQAGPAMIALLKKGIGGIRGLSQELLDAAGITREVARVMNEGLIGGVNGLSSAWEGLGIAIGDSGVLDAITSMVRVGTDFINWLAEVDPAILRFVTVLGAMTFGLSAAAGAVGLLTLALAPIGAPLLLVAGGIAGLAIALQALLPEVDRQAAATDNVTLAIGDEIQQSQLLSRALAGNTSMSLDAARQKLSEARARHENVSAIIAEQRALALQSGEYQATLEEISRTQAALSTVSSGYIDPQPAQGREDAFAAMESRLVELRQKQAGLLATDKALAEQFDRTAQNIADLEAGIAAAEGGVVTFGESMVEPIQLGERLGEVAGGTGGALRELGKLKLELPELAEEVRGTLDGFGEDVGRSLTDAFGQGRASFESFADAFLSIGASLRDRLLFAVFDPIGQAFEGLAGSLLSASSGWLTGGGSGGTVTGIAGLLSAALPGFDAGADFVAGGRGGIDRNIAAFRVSAGERVTVTPRGQSAGGGHVTVNISTPDAASFRASEGQVSAAIARAVARGNRNL